MTEWLAGLTYKDWLLDGAPIRKDWQIELFDDLDWSSAWVDAGPSPAGNCGPYWHVSRKTEDTVHRLYPKVMMGKYAAVVHQAVREGIDRALDKPHLFRAPPPPPI